MALARDGVDRRLRGLPAGAFAAFLLTVSGCGLVGSGEGEAERPEDAASEMSAGRWPATAGGSGHTLPEGIILSHWVNGGIEGLAHELRVTDDGRAELWIFGRLAVSIALSPEEVVVFDDLSERGRAVMKSESDGPDVADGMGVGLLFDGAGDVDLEKEVDDFAARLLVVLQTVAEITSQEIVALGEATHHETDRLTLTVMDVLSAPADTEVVAGVKLELTDFGPRHRIDGQRVWGLTLDPSRPHRILSSRYASPDLLPRILEGLRGAGRGPSHQANVSRNLRLDAKE